MITITEYRPPCPHCGTTLPLMRPTLAQRDDPHTVSAFTPPLELCCPTCRAKLWEPMITIEGAILRQPAPTPAAPVVVPPRHVWDWLIDALERWLATLAQGAWR